MKTILIILLSVLLLSFNNIKTHNCTATWYDTKPYPKVHREYSTAAFNLYNKGDKLIVTNISNNKSDTVVITDRHHCANTHIDLSKTSFSKIANLSEGRIKVKIIKLK